MTEQQGRHEPIEFNDDLPAPDIPTAPNEPMSRETQTWWIVGSILLVGLMILYFITRLPATDPMAKCQRIIGWDEECRGQVIIQRLNRMIY